MISSIGSQGLAGAEQRMVVAIFIARLRHAFLGQVIHETHKSWGGFGTWGMRGERSNV